MKTRFTASTILSTTIAITALGIVIFSLGCDDDTDTSDNPTVSTDDTVTDTGSDTAVSDTDAGSDSTSVSDTASTLGATDCPHTCHTYNWCSINDGIIHEEFNCGEQTLVCCETVPDTNLEADTNTDTNADTNTDSEAGTGQKSDSDGSDTAEAPVCIWECHSPSWCYTNDAQIYEDQSCDGNQICCAVTQP